MAKLNMADGPHFLQIDAVTQEQSQFGSGTQYKFAGTDGNWVYLSETAVTRQLARLGLTPETCVGKLLKFSQVQKDGKSFNNIDLAPGEGAPEKGAPAKGAAPRPAAAPAAYAPPPRRTFEEVRDLYAQCVDAAMMTLGAKLEAAHVPFDGKDIQAAAATMFIAVK